MLKGGRAITKMRKRNAANEMMWLCGLFLLHKAWIVSQVGFEALACARQYSKIASQRQGSKLKDSKFSVYIQISKNLKQKLLRENSRKK